MFKTVLIARPHTFIVSVMKPKQAGLQASILGVMPPLRLALSQVTT